MKNKVILKSLLLTLIILIGTLFIRNIGSVNAESTKLTAGTEININNLNGNLNNINIKFEFTTNVNLDGNNNALLVGLVSSDNTVLTDARFIVSSTNTGVYDEDGVALIYENAPSTIGTKQVSGSNYTYTFESKDFTIKNSSKNIKKLVIVGG